MSVASITLLLVTRPAREAFWAGVPLVVVGEMIRLWSAGYLSKLRKLVTAGPFALCRNPLYVGSFLITSGYLVMCGRLDAWIIGIALFWAFHGGAIAHEERLLGKKFGGQFRVYCQSVPRFIPRLRSLRGEGEFSLRMLLRNDEEWGLVAAAAMTVLFGLRAYHSAFSPIAWVRLLLP